MTGRWHHGGVIGSESNASGWMTLASALTLHDARAWSIERIRRRFRRRFCCTAVNVVQRRQASCSLRGTVSTDPRGKIRNFGIFLQHRFHRQTRMRLWPLRQRYMVPPPTRSSDGCNCLAPP